MSRKYWRISSYDKKQAASVAYEHGYDEFAVLMLNSRGVREPEEISDFLESPTELSDPFLLKDMDKAVNRILRAIDCNEKIAIYGDYDADGVTSTALLYMYLETIGADVMYYIPSRMSEGYGLHNDSVDILYDKGVKLIITVDNGINSVDEAAHIRSHGMGLVITDHHQPGDVLPDADAVVNPHRSDDTSPFKDLAGVGVAFKLASAIENGDIDAVLDDYADIIALGTIADIVPLKGENRTLVIRGMKQINDSPRPGIAAIKSICGYDDKDYNSTNIAFGIAPRINAAGRVESAETALRLLLTEDAEESLEIARKLDEFNSERQSAEAQITDEAVKKIESDDKLKYSHVLVVDGAGWHAGVIGIVASKLVERYGKPTMVIARDGTGESKGSCRSIEGFSLFDALTAANDLLVRFGGHTLAAGFTIRDDKIDEFRDRINEYARTLPPFYPVLTLDCRLNPAYVNISLVDSIDYLEPFGAENPKPVFGIYNLTLKSVVPMGSTGKHIKLVLEREGARLNAVYFGMSREKFPFDAGDVIDIAVTVGKNEFRGHVNVGIYVKAVKDSASDDDKYFASAFLYDKVKIGLPLTQKERDFVCPSRNFASHVFRFIKSRGRCYMTPEQIALRLGLTSASTCKVNVVLDAFCELNLLKYDNGRYEVVDNANKVSLSNASILKELGYTE